MPAAAPLLGFDAKWLRREPYAKLRAQMATDGLDTLVLLHVSMWPTPRITLLRGCYMRVIV